MVVDLGLQIKLSLDYEILNLDLMGFILIYHILSLINWVYILAINLEMLYYDLWHVRYFYWVIFVDLGPSWLTKFVILIWNLNLGLNIYCIFYTFLDIYIWVIFVFTWAHSTILLNEYEFITCGV